VVVLALFVPRGPTLFAAAMSALLWDFFFLPPIFAFRIRGFEDAMLFGIYFVIALVLGHLTAQLRAQQEAEHQREERATALYLLTRELTEATRLEEIVQRTIHHLEEAFKAQVVVLLAEPYRGRDESLQAGALELTEEDERAAAWVLQHGQPAGKFTGNCPSATAFHVPLATGTGVAGVVGLRLRQTSQPTLHQRNLLDAFAQQIALALERHRLQEVSESAKMLAESERLSKTLLDSMSHEMRTPLAAIQGAASHLARLMGPDSSEPKKLMLEEIQEATERLNRLVGNVLDITRLAAGGIKPRVNECDVAELVHLTVAESEKELAGHPITVTLAPGLPIVRMDFVLMQQALSNVLSNAARHTPPGTPVQIAASVVEDDLVLVVTDDGPGIAPALLPRIFDKFYRAPHAATGGTGLGLSLVKGFVEAQGGRVTAENGPGGGMVFTIRLPLRKEMPQSVAELSTQSTL
jgi:two-component system sensor histidine kinase KdpD